MKKLLLLFLLLVFACDKKGIIVTKTDWASSRKTYAGLSEKELDSVYAANPEMNDSMLEKAGLVKDGRLLVEKIHHRDDDFELRNNGETIKVKCSYHEDIPRITLTRDGVSTDIVMNTPYTQFCIADVVPGGYPEIVALETSYIVNGHNYDVTVYEIEENP